MVVKLKYLRKNKTLGIFIPILVGFERIFAHYLAVLVGEIYGKVRHLRILLVLI